MLVSKKAVGSTGVLLVAGLLGIATTDAQADGYVVTERSRPARVRYVPANYDRVAWRATHPGSIIHVRSEYRPAPVYKRLGYRLAPAYARHRYRPAPTRVSYEHRPVSGRATYEYRRTPVYENHDKVYYDKPVYASARVVYESPVVEYVQPVRPRHVVRHRRCRTSSPRLYLSLSGDRSCRHNRGYYRHRPYNLRRHYGGWGVGLDLGRAE